MDFAPRARLRAWFSLTLSCAVSVCATGCVIDYDVTPKDDNPNILDDTAVEVWTGASNDAL